MIIDDYTEFCDDYDAGAAGVSNEIVNMGDVIPLTDVRNIGRGNPVYVVFTISETFADTSSGAGISFRVVSDSTATPSVVAEAATLHLSSEVFADTELTAGKIFSFVLPTLPAYEGFLGVQLSNDAADALTAGKVNAFLSLSPVGSPADQHFADAAN
jgi:hypothetical protein